MPKIVPIVEGDGEIGAVPILLARILNDLQRWDVHVATPKNAHGRTNLTKPGGIERFTRYALMEPQCAAISIIVDSEGACPRDLALELGSRVATIAPNRPVAIICAHRMYEAWFLASMETIAGRDLDGQPGVVDGSHAPADAESVANPKAWITSHMPTGRSYKETEDQAPLTRLMNMDLARHGSRSFRRMWHAVEELVDAIDGMSVRITPA